MEEKRILCKNNGMQRDINISAINQDGNIMYAFDNHNIRITSNEDNTIWTVTNEKSTEYIGNIAGIFMGACIIDKYLVLFIKDATGISGYLGEDYIYRLEVITQDEGIEKVEVKMLYNGNLNFNVEHPIEAIGYYENEDVIKVYWVDGINPNRFINVAKIPKEVFYIIDANNKRTENNEYFLGEQVQKEKGIPLYEIKGTDGELYYYTLLNPRLDFIDFNRGFFYDKTEVENIISGTDWTEDNIRSLKGSAKRCLKGFEYVDTSFDFQGEVYSIPDIKIRKDYNLSGHFQAGVIQYFFTYYNKFGQETPIIYNSDLQYLSIKDRGAKADEAVVCGFIIDVTNIDVKYDYLRIYAAYRSGLNGTVTSRIVGELDLSKQRVESTLRFVDLGNEGQTFNSNDLFYVGGQNIIGGTIEHKEDTLFVGDITIKGNTSQYDLPKYTKMIPEVQNTPLDEEEIPKPIEIQEGGSADKPFIEWVYQYTSEVPTSGVYTHTNELQESQEEIAGFKWREFYRFGIQFMNKTGEWSSAFWLGDKYCNLKPISINEECFIDDWKDTYSSNVVLLKKEDKDKDDLNTVRVYSPTGSIAGSKKIVETEDEAGNKKRDEITMYCDNFKILYQGYGNYIAKAKVNIDYIKEACKEINDAGYIGYRLLLAHPDESNRRIITQGVINPTMFNFYDRYYDIPHSIPSWVFRPRNGFVINRHYDTLPVQTESNAELQGIIKRKAPVLKTKSIEYEGKDIMNAYLCVLAVQKRGGKKFYTQYEYIYYDSGHNEEEKTGRMKIMSWSPIYPPSATREDIEKDIKEIAELCAEYEVALIKGQNDWKIRTFVELTKTSTSTSFTVTPTPEKSIDGEGSDYYDTSCQIHKNNKTKEQVKAELEYLLRQNLDYFTLKNGYSIRYGQNDSDPKTGQSVSAVKDVLWQPCWVYDNKYQVIACNNGRNDKDSGDNANQIREGILKAQEWTKCKWAEDILGKEVAGYDVLKPNVFPSGGMLQDLRNRKGKGWVAAMIGSIAAAVGAIVASVFTFGAATPLAVLALTMTANICVAGAIGLGAVAMISKEDYDKLPEWQKQFYSKGWIPIEGMMDMDGVESTSNDAYHIGKLYTKMFRPGKNEYGGWGYNATKTAVKEWKGWQSEDKLGGKNDLYRTHDDYHSYSVPRLNKRFAYKAVTKNGTNTSEMPRPNGGSWETFIHNKRTGGRSGRGSAGLGRYFNAMYKIGEIGDMSLIEKELLEKQNLYNCDESVVTLNSPEVEDIYHYVNEASSYNLELIGAIPLSSNKGLYEMYTESGLTDLSQVLKGRFLINDIKQGFNGQLVNGKFYQDWVPPIFEAKDWELGDGARAYKTFMWNRQTSAGCWFPANPEGKFLNQVGEQITSPRGKITKKIFANLSFSATTDFYNPFKMDIEKPIVCLDDDSVIKNFEQNDTYYKYQQAINTLSINNEKYSLVIGEELLPTNNEQSSIKDAISIKYKETPHVLLPLKYKAGVATILPFQDSDEPISPSTLYDVEPIISEDGENAGEILNKNEVFDASLYDWDGIQETLKFEINKYIYLPDKNLSAKGHEDVWKKENDELKLWDLFELHGRLVSENNLWDLFNRAKGTMTPEQAINTICINSSGTLLKEVYTYLFDRKRKYLYHASLGTYYLIYYQANSWKSQLLTQCVINTELIIYKMSKGDSPYMKYDYREEGSKSIIYSKSGDNVTDWDLWTRDSLISLNSIPTVSINLDEKNIEAGSENSHLDEMINRNARVSNNKDPRAIQIKKGEIGKPTISGTYYYLKKYPIRIATRKTHSKVAKSVKGGAWGTSVYNIIYKIPVNQDISTPFLIKKPIEFGSIAPVVVYEGSNTITIPTAFREYIEFSNIPSEREEPIYIRCVGAVGITHSQGTNNKGVEEDGYLYDWINGVIGCYSYMLLFEIVDVSKVAQDVSLLVSESLYATDNISEDNINNCLLDKFYTDIFTKYRISNTWLQQKLDWYFNTGGAYLFLGELVKKIFDYKSWMGGIEENALEQLVWDVASHPTNMDKNIINSWGDTYYQRWDCLKTYPYTEDDPNSIVEVLSYMCETHKNIAGRCDTNRGENNLLTTRPENTMYNNVYEQLDNFFTYTLLDEKFFKNHFKADFVWSLKKRRLDDIDVWTSLTSLNEMSLDGRYGTLRKILNSKNNLIAFQDRAINVINYNDKVALNTTTDMPVQLGNTGKVTGYTMVTDEHGCRNKFAINKNSTGVYFIDDLNKTFNFIGGENGIASISTKANFSAWFKHNVNGELLDASKFNNFILSYDESTNDLYLIKNDTCLVYNTILGRFVSFMDYTNTPLITRLANDKGLVSSYALHGRVDKDGVRYLDLWKMFSKYTTEENGENKVYHYNYIFGKFAEYSMEYRITPNAVTESIFTNYLFTADWIDPVRDVDGENLFNEQPIIRFTSFDEIEAKNEYQKGKATITPTLNHNFGNRQMGIQDLKNKFRIWRGNIPRDGDGNAEARPFMRDRMRNMWIHLKLTKKKADDSKMIFHDLLVTYFN